jgi:pilus assembly protein FimV
MLVDVRKCFPQMMLSQKLKWITLALALVCVATVSTAMTLGRARGAVLLGHPLELVIPVQLAVDEDGSGVCFDADVFYGDVRQEASLVTITHEALPQSNSIGVRIQTRANIDEPVVTVYLRAGCGRQAARRYVLLADLATDLSPPTIATPTLSTLPKSAVPTVIAVNGPIRTEVPAKGGEISKKQRPVISNTNPSPDRVRSGAARARLKLAPVDLGPERDPALLLSNELLTLVTDDAHKREEAAAMWRALNATPQDVLRDAARLLAMERDLKLVQAQSLKDRLTLTALTERLDKSEAQRYANPLVYGMLLLLLLSVSGLMYLYFQYRSTNMRNIPWWSGPSGENSSEVMTSEFVPIPQVETEPESTTGIAVNPLGPVDIDLPLADSAFADLGKPSPISSHIPDLIETGTSVSKPRILRPFVPSVSGPLREISSQEMLDARQQADFFVTLGQHDEAIRVLSACINEGGDLNPLVYLDLLKIFHTLSQKTDYEQYRSQFNELFTGIVPPYADFNLKTKTLDDYPQFCDRMVSLWPSNGAVELIERNLVRHLGMDQFEAFDLEAYRDLLMLYAVGKRLTTHSENTTDSGLAVFSAQRHTPSLPISPVQETSNFSIDLDLSEPENNLIEFDPVGFQLAPTNVGPEGLRD